MTNKLITSSTHSNQNIINNHITNNKNNRNNHRINMNLNMNNIDMIPSEEDPNSNSDVINIARKFVDTSFGTINNGNTLINKNNFICITPSSTITDSSKYIVS